MYMYYTIFLFINLISLNDCFHTLMSNDALHHLGTRTPYRFKYNNDDSKINFPNCKDIKIWMLARHGTRLPSIKDIQGMNTTLKDLKHQILLQHKLGKGKLNEEQIEKLKNWTSIIDDEQEKLLTREGQEEMTLLAERMQKRFPNIIKNEYNNNTFYFQHTATQRAFQSARYFTIGLFEKKDAQNVLFAPASTVDPILRFYKHCDRWQEQVKNNPSTYHEQVLFGKSKQMNKTLEEISMRLGFSNILSLDDTVLMYRICGYETSWHKFEISPWCYGFDADAAQKLEYYHDLKHYWMDGYGYNLTSQQACLPIKIMFESFRSAEEPNATFLFAHSGTLLKILSHIQLYKPPSPLTANVMQKSRSWKTSAIDCFASNLAFVLYRCKDGDKILTLHQEKIVKLPMCKEDLCPLKNLTEYFHDSIYNCNLSEICSINNTTRV